MPPYAQWPQWRQGRALVAEVRREEDDDGVGHVLLACSPPRFPPGKSQEWLENTRCRALPAEEEGGSTRVPPTTPFPLLLPSPTSV